MISWVPSDTRDRRQQPMETHCLAAIRGLKQTTATPGPVWPTSGRLVLAAVPEPPRAGEDGDEFRDPAELEQPEL